MNVVNKSNKDLLEAKIANSLNTKELEGVRIGYFISELRTIITSYTYYCVPYVKMIDFSLLKF